MKKLIKKLLDKTGLVVLKKENFYKLTTNHIEPQEKTISHTIHLDFLLKLLKDLGYQPQSIFDIGANKGGWTANALEYFPNANYYLFEPQTFLIDEIKSRFSKNPNVQFYPYGVGSQRGTMEFTIHDRDDSSNFRMTKDEALARGFKQIQTQVVSVDEFVQEQNLIKPDILKIDAEGIDLMVIEGAKETLNSHSEVVMVEVAVMNPLFENTALKVMNKMDSLGFKLFDITDLNRPFQRNVLWLSEFVFIRKGGVLDKNYHL
ncbi:MAG: FkbM family methyltransferase [Cytophagales bacterium]